MPTLNNSQSNAQNLTASSDADSLNAATINSSAIDKVDDIASSAPLTIEHLIEAQVAFMQQWLRSHAKPLTLEAWQWLGAQP